MNLKNIDQRIKGELLDLTDRKIPIKVIKQSEPEILSWLGGSRIASSSFVKKIAIKKNEYYEFGKRIVRQRFF